MYSNCIGGSFSATPTYMLIQWVIARGVSAVKDSIPVDSLDLLVLHFSDLLLAGVDAIKADFFLGFISLFELFCLLVNVVLVHEGSAES